MEYRMMSEIDWYVITNSYIQYDLYSCERSNLYKLYSYIIDAYRMNYMRYNYLTCDIMKTCMICL